MSKISAAEMFAFILDSFSSRHKVRQDGDDFYITNPNGDFVLKTFSRESIKGPSDEVRQSIDELVDENQAQGLATGFLFLRSDTDYSARKNKGAFLKQSWDKDKKTGKSDHYNVKKLTKIEIAVASLYDSGPDNNGYRSRVAYFNPKTGKIETVRFRENSSEHRISNTIGYVCDWKCIRGIYQPDEIIDHARCKIEKKCTMYARGRDKREVRVTELKSPLRIVKKGDLYIAEIK